MRIAAGLVAVLSVLGLSACSGSGSSSPRPLDDPGAAQVPVTLTDQGCNPTDFALHAGSVVFVVTNPSTKKVTEMEVQDANGHVRGDIEGVTAGHTRSFRVVLQAGATYRVRCPESAPTGGSIVVN